MNGQRIGGVFGAYDTIQSLKANICIFIEIMDDSYLFGVYSVRPPEIMRQRTMCSIAIRLDKPQSRVITHILYYSVFQFVIVRYESFSSLPSGVEC